MIKAAMAMLAAVIVILLVLRGIAHLPNEQPNGFTRKLTANPLVPVKELPLNVPLEGICGKTAGHLYFTVPRPGWLIRLDTALTRQDTFAFGLPEHNIPGVHQTIADPPQVFFFANNIPAVYRGNWDLQQFDTLYQPGNTFSRAAYLPPDNIVLRVMDKDLKRQQLQKINIHTGKVEAANYLFAEQAGGGFDKDGILRYDPVSKKLFYIELYRNSFYCLDTALQLLYTAHTIDTIQHNPVTVKWVKWENEQRLMPSKPRTTVTLDAVAAKGYLFVLSNLRADNESANIFRRNAVIDMYRIGDGTYYGSFYIPHYNGEAVKSFAVYDNSVVALYKSRVARFRLDD